MKWIVRAAEGSDLKRKRSVEMPWARRKALVSRMQKIDTGILTNYSGMYNFVQFFGLRFEKESSIMMGNPKKYLEKADKVIEKIKQLAK